MDFFKVLSIKNKILFIIFFVIIISLGSTFTFTIFKDLRKFKKDLLEKGFLISKLIGDYSIYDLTFNLKEESKKMLSHLKIFENIEEVVIFNKEGKIFSYYTKEQNFPSLHYLKGEGYEFKKSYLLFWQPLFYKKEMIGSLAIKISTKDMIDSIKEYLILMFFFFIFLMALSFSFAFWLQKYISRPINALTEAVEYVSREKDYSINVKKESNDEVGVLCDGFNLMLSEIKKHEADREDLLEALKRSEQKFIHIIEQSNDAIYVLYKNSLVFVNPKFEEFFGYSLSEIRSKKFLFTNIVSIEDKEKIQGRLNKISLNEEVPSKFIFKGVSKSEVEKYFEANESEIVWDDKLAILGILRDITERIEFEERLKIQEAMLREYAKELERSNKELDQFAYVTSHDLKAPLRAISNLTSWIEEDLGENLQKEVKEKMELLKNRVKRMENLINAILEYSRVGRIKGTIEKVNLNLMIRDIIEFISPPASFEIFIQENMPSFETEKIRLEQVFANLISNAIKHHNKERGKIEITYKDLENFYEFTVKDDGPGIAPEYHEKIFEIFQTLQARDKFESTGIGLTLVKKIVEAQGGKVYLISEEGKGSSFVFTWPKKPKIY